MRRFRIEIFKKSADPREAEIVSALWELGFRAAQGVQVVDVYHLEGRLTSAQARSVAERLLTDPVVEKYYLGKKRIAGQEVEVAYNPAVTDPVEESVRKAILDSGLRAASVKTGKRYIFKGRISKEDIVYFAPKLLYNPIIQHLRFKEEELKHRRKYRFRRIEVDLSKHDLDELSRRMSLALNHEEMLTMVGYFEKLGRNPTDVEIETIAQTWSEHCKHKTFRGIIEYDGKRIDDLLKSTVIKATEELNKPWCLSVFHDNSGVIEFDDEYGVCFKVETHNHPSALEPYGGASTGIGGVIRDIIGTGRGAKPIMNTDVFCFGEPDLPYKDLPPGVLHPKRIALGVVAGVRDYGNRMGIPTASGTVYYDNCYVANPLVYCGTVGLIKKTRIEKGARPGDNIVLVGGRTGRDGIHGVTFASLDLTSESETMSSCVQIGNPIMEKKFLDTVLAASDKDLFTSLTDCGGGGLSSAIGEMGQDLGVVVDLDKVPLKYEGLSYTEIWISEAQERMVLAVPNEKLAEMIGIFETEDVLVTVIGRFTGDRRLVLRYHGAVVADMDMEFVHRGLPRSTKQARAGREVSNQAVFPEPADLKKELLNLLASLNISSKEWVVRQYDHEVQGGSVVKPFVGIDASGPSDAVVIRPRLDSYRGIVVSCGLCPRYGRIDPYRMGASAIDEALRNLTAVGGSIEKVGLLDNFCFGNPERPEVLADIVDTSRACYDVAKGFGTPFISGKDSLYNEYKDRAGRPRAILPTLLISAMGVVEDTRRCITMDLKGPDNGIYLVGLTRPELGGSEYFLGKDCLAGEAPLVDVKTARSSMTRLHEAITRGLLLSCHDCSEGGLAVALAEMCLAGGAGATVDLRKIVFPAPMQRNDFVLFSESNSRFLVEVPISLEQKFAALMGGLPCSLIGRTTRQRPLCITGLAGKEIVRAGPAELGRAWRANQM